MSAPAYDSIPLLSAGHFPPTPTFPPHRRLLPLLFGTILIIASTLLVSSFYPALGPSIRNYVTHLHKVDDIRCSLTPPPSDPCGTFEVKAYFYNRTSESCESFIWRGCPGAVPFWWPKTCVRADCKNKIYIPTPPNPSPPSSPDPTPTPAPKAPLCCSLPYDTIMGGHVETGNVVIGKELTSEAQTECLRQGDGSWCVALWTDGDWWCSSPGKFLEHLNGYELQCPTGQWPEAGVAPQCCSLSIETVLADKDSAGEYMIGDALGAESKAVCGHEGDGNWCTAKWTNGKWWCTSPGKFLEHSSGYGSMCPTGVWP